MNKVSKRISLSLDEKMLASLSKLKRKEFYDKSYAELYRFVMEQGLTAIANQSKKGE